VTLLVTETLRTTGTCVVAQVMLTVTLLVMETLRTARTYFVV
jgi:hypothetical protein